MVRRNFFLLLIFSSTLNHAIASGLWREADINDPNLSVSITAQQCSKSLMYAPHKLELWCEKAYEMGSWRSLLYISYYTGDGTRYVNEVQKQVESGDIEAIKLFAWIYNSGSFVKRDVNKAIELYESYLDYKKNESITEIQLNSVHKELYNTYKELENWRKASEHLQFLIEHEDDAIYKSLLIKQMEDIKKTLNSK